MKPSRFLLMAVFLMALAFLAGCQADTGVTTTGETTTGTVTTTEYVENRVSDDVPSDFIITHYLEYSADNIFNYSAISFDTVTGTLKFNYMINADLVHLGMQIDVIIRNIDYAYGEEVAMSYLNDDGDAKTGIVTVNGMTSGKTYEVYAVVYHHDGTENDTIELFHFKSAQNALTKKAWVDLTSDVNIYNFDIYDPETFIDEIQVIVADETNGGIIFRVDITDFTDFLIGDANDIVRVVFEYGTDFNFEEGVLYSFQVLISGNNGVEVLEDFQLYYIEDYIGG